MEKLLIKTTLIVGIMLLLSGIAFGIALQYVFPEWDFSDAGPMGDTFGGFLSPVMNLVGAVLVYFSFKQQQEANKLQFDALKEDRDRINSLNKFNQIVNLMDDISKLLKSFEVRYKGHEPGLHIVKGAEALVWYSENLAETKQGVAFMYEIKKPIKTSRLYLNFLNLLSFTSNAVVNYHYQGDHSKDVLKMKFTNLVSGFQNEVSNVSSHSSAFSEKTATEVQQLTAEFLANIKQIKKKTS